MDLFKEYGFTKEELQDTLEDAINFVELNDDGQTVALAERLENLYLVFNKLTKEYTK